MPRPRIATRRVTALLRRSPALAILGARQAGKSTLARLAFPGFVHIDLERPLDLARAPTAISRVMAIPAAGAPARRASP
jgi:hypothetical protein